MRLHPVFGGLFVLAWVVLSVRCDEYEARSGDDASSPPLQPSAPTAASSSGAEPIADASLEAEVEAEAPPVACLSRREQGRFCAEVAPMRCTNARAGESLTAVLAPVESGTAAVYFTDTFGTAPFDLALDFTFRTGSAFSGILAMFLGGTDQPGLSLCARLDTLQPGETAVLFWRAGQNDYRTAIATGCSETSWAPTPIATSADIHFTLHARYDGAAVRVDGVADRAGLTMPSASRALSLRASTAVGVVVEGTPEFVYLSRIEMTCDPADAGQ